MANEVETMAKSALISFLDDDRSASKALLRDIENRYSGPDISYYFQYVSNTLYDIFAGVVSAFLFYKLYESPRDKKAASAIRRRFRSIIKSQERKLEYHLASLEKRMDILAQHTENDERRWHHYQAKCSALRRRGASKTIIVVLEKEYRRGPKKQARHVDEYRDR